MHMRSVRLFALALATELALLSGLATVVGPLAAQAPRPIRPVAGPTDFAQWINTQSWERAVTVSSAGNAQFRTVSSALTYVATQARGATKRWSVLVYPGTGGGYPLSPVSNTANWSYTETSTLAVPTYTTVQGMAAHPGASGAEIPSALVTIGLGRASGSVVTLATGSALVDLGLYYYGANSAATSVVLVNGGGHATLSNVSITGGTTAGDGFDLALLKVASGSSATVYGGITKRIGTATLTRSVVSESSSGLALYGGRHTPGTSQAKLMETTGSGLLQLFGVRIDSGATAELVETAGSIESFGSSYTVAAAAVSDGIVRAAQVVLAGTCKWISGAGSPESAVAAPVCSIYTRTDGGADTTLYVKESGSGNTGWVAK